MGREPLLPPLAQKTRHLSSFAFCTGSIFSLEVERDGEEGEEEREVERGREREMCNRG